MAAAFVEVNITNPTRLAQDSQDTANKAVRGVENLNDPNMMNVIEKQNNIVQFAGLTSQYNVLVQNAKDEGIDTTAVTTAYNNLNIFMADILADPNHASDIDRARYKKYQDAYNEELAKLQNALQNNANDKFTSAASAISQAASTANVAKSAADSAYTYANSEIAVQSIATAKAQSTADGAFSQAQAVGSQADSAIAVQSTATAKAQSTADNAFSQAQAVGSQASAEIAIQSEAITGAQSKADSALAKAEEVDGKTSAEIAKQSAATAKAQEAATSALDKAQSAADYTDKQIASQASAVSEVSKNAAEASSKANSALDTANGANAEIVKLKGGSTATIAKLEDGLGTKVSNDTFDSYQTQTASQFAQTVKEADFKTYQTQTSKLIESKVDNGTYQTDKTQTAEAIDSKVSSGEFKTYQTQTDKALASKVSGSDYESDREQTASQIADKVSNGEFSTYKTQTDELIGSKVDNGDFKTYQTQTSELINSKVDNGTYQSDKTQTANQIASKVSSADFNSYKSQTDKAIESKVSSADFNNLKISNRNLALGTATAFKVTGQNIGNQSTNGYVFSKTISKGTVVTVTFDVSSTTGIGNFVVQFNGNDDGASWQEVTHDTLPKGTKHVSKTFTIDAEQQHIYFRLDNATGDIEFSNFIISESSKEVNWTPAPEDQASQSQVTQLSGQIDQKVSSGDFNSYKTQIDKLISEKVSNGDFNSYKSQTSELINSKVDNGTYQSDKTQTADAIASKVSSNDFKTYQTQTDKLIESKVDNGTYQSDKTQTANQIADKVSNGAFNTYKTQTDKLIAEKVSNGDFSTYKSQTADLISSKVATKDFSAYQATTAKSIESKVESSDFNTYKQQTDKAITSKVESSNFQSLQNQVQNSAVGTNLIVLSDLKSGYISAGNVVVGSNGDFHSDNYIPTNGATVFTFSSPDYVFKGSSNHHLLMYDSDKNYLGFQSITSATQTLSKSNVAYIRFSMNFVNEGGTSGNLSDWLDSHRYKLEKGSVATDYSLSPEDQATKSQITQLSGQIDQKVSSGDFNSYKTQTDKLISEKVSNGDFTTYKSQTADLISARVATKDFKAYQDTTAKAISSKVESSDFNTYKTQTDSAISSKVSSTDFNNLTISNRNLALNTATGFVMQGNNTANQCLPFKTSRAITKGTTITVSFDIVSTTAMGTFIIQLIGGDWQQVTANVDNPLTTTEKHYTHTLVAMSDHADGVQLRLDNATGKVTMTNFIISESSKEVSWTPAPEDQATQSQITQLSNDINLRVTKDGLLDQINLQAGKTLISSSGQLTLSANSVFLDSANPVIMKSANIDKLLVGKKLTAADISANTFTTNNGTFTVNQNGAITAKDMTLSGGKLYSPTINAGTITSAIINGTTFHGGDVINNQHNTSHFYPMTIESSGAYKTTFYDQMVGLQSIIESGGLQHKFRSMVADSDGHFVASNAALDGQGFHSQSGYTSAKDSNFSSPQTITGYVDVTPATGIYLYGPTQQINFAGKSGNIGSNGITMDAYGNIYGQSDSAWWRVGDVNGNQIINFGIDKGGSNYTEFKRNIQVGNIGINTAHSITMQDGKGLYINSGKGGRADLNVASLNYQGSVSKSLLSEKKDVKKVDTSYWAQLVNSIDLATYQYKDDDNTSNLRLSGIVDDVNADKQWNLPDIFVARDEDGKLSGIENIVLQNAMLATIQEQQKEIDKLNGHLLELEAKLNG